MKGCLHLSLFCLFKNWIFSLFTFQMLTPFPVSPLQTPYPIPPYPASMRVLPHPPTHSCLTSLAFLYTEASNLHRTKGLPSNWCQIRALKLLQSFPSLLCSVWWLAVSICICIGQNLAEPLRRQLYQAPVSKLFLAPTIVCRFGFCIWDGFPSWTVSWCPFLQSLFHFLSLYFL